MPDPNFIPSPGTVITIDAENLSLEANVINPAFSNAVKRKVVFGSPAAFKIQGVDDGQLQVGGHMSAEISPKLWAIWQKKVVTWSVQVGPAGGSVDGGLYTGNAVVSAFNPNAQADGEWDWTMTLDLSGVSNYAGAGTGSS